MPRLHTKVKVPNIVPLHIRDSLASLTGEAKELLCDWQMFKELFMDSENVTLINKALPGFMERVQSLLYKSLIIGIARFTDRQTVRDGNQSIVLNDLFIPTDVKRLEKVSANIRKIRNKIVAHLDRKYAINPALLPTQKIISEMRASIELIEAVIQEAWKKWARGTISLAPPPYAQQALACLKKTSIYDRLEKKEVLKFALWDRLNYSDDYIEKHLSHLPKAPKES